MESRLEKLEAIAAKAAELRENQKAFFRGERDRMPICKQQERELDQLLKNLDDTQTRMF